MDESGNPPPVIWGRREVTQARHSGAPRSGEPGIHSPQPVFMDSGLPRFARPPE